MGFLSLGEGFLKGTSFVMDAVDHGVNWTSMATGGFGNDDWAMAHAKEIETTNANVRGMIDKVMDPNYHEIADAFFSNAEGVARGEKKAWGNAIELGGAFAAAPGFKAKLPGETAVKQAVKTGTQKSIDTAKKALTGETATLIKQRVIALSKSAATGVKESYKKVAQVSRQSVRNSKAAVPNKAVIGKVDDLNAPGALKPGENTLLKHLPDQGNPQANWKQNSSVLRQEMNKGKPIRDASVDANGQLRDNTGFLRAERNLLENKGWTYDPSTQVWSPP